MALELGDPPSIDGDPIVKQSEVDKWKRRSMILSVLSFILGVLVSIGLTFVM